MEMRIIKSFTPRRPCWCKSMSMLSMLACNPHCGNTSFVPPSRSKLTCWSVWMMPRMLQILSQVPLPFPLPSVVLILFAENVNSLHLHFIKVNNLFIFSNLWPIVRRIFSTWCTGAVADLETESEAEQQHHFFLTLFSSSLFPKVNFRFVLDASSDPTSHIQ